MLNPRRSGVNRPSVPSRLGTSQKKYTSHSASPNANRTLSPALDRPPRRIVASLSKSKLLAYPRCCRCVERTAAKSLERLPVFLRAKGDTPGERWLLGNQDAVHGGSHDGEADAGHDQRDIHLTHQFASCLWGGDVATWGRRRAKTFG